MSTESKDQSRREEGYERRDASARALLKFGLGLAALIVIVLLAMRWTFLLLSKEEPLGPPPTPFENARVLPPEPLLQVEPHQDLKTFCDGQLNSLNSYGWMDQSNGVVHIPIDRAMEKLLIQGLPARPAAAANWPEGAATTPAPVGTVEAPRPTGTGGPCSFLAERSPTGENK
jgi:hypothetical protein